MIRPKNRNATRLTTQDVQRIRELYKIGEHKINSLSAMYRVGAVRIMRILSNRTHNEVGGYTIRKRCIRGGAVDFKDIKVYESDGNDSTGDSGYETETPPPTPQPVKQTPVKPPVKRPPQKEEPNVEIDVDLAVLLEEITQEQEDIRASRKKRLEDKYKTIS